MYVACLVFCGKLSSVTAKAFDDGNWLRLRIPDMRHFISLNPGFPHGGFGKGDICRFDRIIAPHKV
jgi:hypothetical protein